MGAKTAKNVFVRMLMNVRVLSTGDLWLAGTEVEIDSETAERAARLGLVEILGGEETPPEPTALEPMDQGPENIEE